MAITLKPAALNSFNLSLNTLHENLNNVTKNKRYNTLQDAVKSIKKNNNVDPLDCSTCATSEDLKSDYSPPLLNDNIIYNLVKEDNIIYNKEFKTDTYKSHPLFFVNFNVSDTTINTTVYAFGYKPLQKYNYMVCKFGLYFCSNLPFFFIGIDPFTLKQYYTLIQL